MDNISDIGELLDRYARDYPCISVAADEREDAGVPLVMQSGPVNDEGWVEWKILPSTLTLAEVLELEQEFGVKLPSAFRSYLLARFHLFDQVRSPRHNQLICMTDTPAGRPLKPLRDILNAWSWLIDAGYIPFAEWGDGWGPMCFDAGEFQDRDDYPIVWMDHEVIIPLGREKCRQREIIQPLTHFLYSSCQEFLLDVFGQPL